MASALVAATMLVPAAQAQTGGYGYAPGGYEQGDGDGRGYDDPRGYGDGRANDRGYDDRGGYVYARRDVPPPPPPPGYSPAGYASRGYGRVYRCDRGAGGTILGAIAGGLLGNGIAGRGDRAAGTIVGAGVGALAGRAIDRSC